MPSDPNPSQSNEGPPASPAAPPILPPPAPPVLASTAQPPPSASTPGSHNLIRVLLNLFIALFLADAAITFLDDLLTLLFGAHLLTGLSGMMLILTFLAGLVVYLLMGVTPLIPKRFFLPLALFIPLSMLLTIPALIYFYGPTQRSGIIISTAQIILGLAVAAGLQRGFKFQGPLVKENHLGRRGFSWLNLLGFGFVNVFVLLPLVACYLFFCASLAVHHFGEGFIELRPSGIFVQVRKYVRNDGRTVELVPMSHIGEPAFYRSLSASFPTNALILMEGVTDEQNLLTNKISYQRMAKSLGLAEQQREFKPSLMHLVRADVDISQFRKSTISFLNLVMLIHGRGLQPENVMQLMTISAPPDLQEQLFDDLLNKRNQHVVGELEKRLPDWDHIIIPWGAAHMPGISHELQRLGFHVAERRQIQAVAFHFFGRKRKTVTTNATTGNASIPAIAGLAGVRVGYSTQEDLATLWGEGKVALGGHSNSGRLWRIKGTSWLLYTDGFEYSERGLVVDSLQLVDTAALKSPLRSEAEPKVNTMKLWNTLETNQDIPYATATRQDFACLGELAIGSSRKKAKAFLERSSIPFKETANGFEIDAKGLHAMVTAKFSEWTVSLVFTNDALAQIDMGVQ